MSGHCCHSALDESQPWTMSLTTQGCYLLVFCTRTLPIRRQWLVASPSLLPRLPNLTWTVLLKHVNPLSPNPFSIIEVFQWQPLLESLQKICNRNLPIQGSIALLFQTVLSRDNGQMLLLETPSHPYFLPLVEWCKVGLPHPLRKLLKGEFRWLQADWGFAFSPVQVRRIIALILCIQFVIRNLW